MMKRAKNLPTLFYSSQCIHPAAGGAVHSSLAPVFACKLVCNNLEHELVPGTILSQKVYTCRTI